MVITDSKLKLIPKCVPCELLGQGTPNSVLLMVTLSPNPQWHDYADLLPDEQHKLLASLFFKKSIIDKIQKHFDNKFNHLSTHYEFNSSGQLHSHSLVSIPSVYDYKRNHLTISKIFHQVIGMQYVKSSICADVRNVTDNDVYKYLNKENAYDPFHKMTLEHYMQKDATLQSVTKSDIQKDATDSDTDDEEMVNRCRILKKSCRIPPTFNPKLR